MFTRFPDVQEKLDACKAITLALYMCMYVCMYVCMYIYICLCLHGFQTCKEIWMLARLSL